MCSASNDDGDGNANVDGNVDGSGDDDVESRQHAFTLQAGTLLTALPDCSIQSRAMMTTWIDLLVMKSEGIVLQSKSNEPLARFSTRFLLSFKLVPV